MKWNVKTTSYDSMTTGRREISNVIEADMMSNNQGDLEFYKRVDGRLETFAIFPKGYWSSVYQVHEGT